MNIKIMSVIKKLLDSGVFVYLDKGTLKTRGKPECITKEVITLIKSNKHELIEYLMSEESSDQAADKNVTILPVSRCEEGGVLSFSQLRLWLFDRMEESSSLYNNVFALRLTGNLHVSALQKTFSTIIRRHESLRTIFVDAGDEPVQKINPAQMFDLGMVDMSGLDRPDQEKAVQNGIDCEFSKSFDLTADLMLRAKLLTLSENDYVLVATMHHIASDGWSTGVLIHELSQLYQAYVDGRENPLSPLPIQYADYAHWQRQWLQGEVLDKYIDYWQQKLLNLPVVHSLPLDYKRPQRQTFSGAAFHSHLDQSRVDGLMALCGAQGATLFMGLNAVFSVLLARYSGEPDIVVGSPIANREQKEVEGLIGFFVNTLVLRNDISGSPSFIELLQQSKQTALDAYSHQQMPFEQLVEALQPERSLSHSPLFQIMLVLQNNDKKALKLPGLTLAPVEKIGVQAKFDLTLSAVETGNGLSLEWEYNTDLFCSETMQRMADHLALLLDGFLTDPEKNVYDLPLLNASEREKLLARGNDAQVDFSADHCIHELFEQEVEKNSDAPALIFENQILNYGDLNQRANQLAHYLINEKHVQSGSLVGICLNRSFDMVVAMLGILKSGCAYVPLDSEYPEERLIYMLKDAGLATVITTSDVVSKTPISSAQALCVDNDIVKRRLLSQSVKNLLPSTLKLTTKGLAYVIYTSGSSGNPKGVMIAHQGLINLMDDNAKRFSIGQNTRFLQNTSVSFDAASWVIWMSLSHGASVVVAKELIADSHYLETLINREKISHLMMVPSSLSLLDPGHIQNLQCVIVGGDTCPQTLSDKWSESFEFFNAYGPTENTICSSVKKIACNETVNIGRAIQNTRAYVLDSRGEPQPIGVAGELHLSGVGLAQGYLNRPEMTAEKFIPNPFDGISDRLYKTGDLVRWLANGDLAYLGRIDNQVKIRGFRIEVGEIEKALLDHQVVKDVVVVARDQGAGDKRLIAYIVKDHHLDADKSDAGDFRQYLHSLLPEYMIPSFIMLLDALPLTQNGKVDRKSLPMPDDNQLTEVYRAPVTQVAKTLCEIFQEVLGVSRVGLNDNFFHLGGHSLLAVRLVNAVKIKLDKDITLRQLMDALTVEELVSFLERDSLKTIEFETLTPDPENRYQAFPLTKIQQAYWMGRKGDFELGNVGAHLYSENPFFDLDCERFQAAFNQLIQRHDMLRMVVTSDGQQKVLKTVPNYVIAVADCRNDSNEDAKAKQLEVRDSMSHHVFSGEQWPLFDIRISQLTNKQSILHFSMDALVLDASSLMILSQEVSALYDNPKHVLPDLSLTFRDYVLAEKNLMKLPVYHQSKDYWLDRIVDFPARPALPLAVDPSSIDQPRFERRSYVLDRSKWQPLLKMARRFQVTPTSLFLGCFSEVLYQWCETPHFALNLTLFNRIPLHSQVNNILGDFTSLTLLEMDYRDTSIRFCDRLKAIQKQLWADLECRYFDGLEVLSALRKDSGQSVSYPVVVTSTLGLEPENSGERGNNTDANNNDEEEGYSISQTSQVWLDVKLSEDDGSLNVVWDSVEGLFPCGMLDAMFSSLQTLFLNLFEQEECWQSKQLVELPVEQRQLIDSVNDTEMALGVGLLHDPLKRQIQLHGKKVAVRSRDKALTYDELGKRSQILSYQLQENGACANQLIAVVMEKGWQQVVAVLGILEAGAAYLPVDASLPQARIDLLLEAGEVSQVVTTGRYKSRISNRYLTVFINDGCVNSEYAERIKKPDWIATSRLDTRAKPEDLAYVIFTSGSTGQPKGVMIDHQGALNTVQDINQRYKVESNDSVFGLSNLSFDLSVYDIFGVLGAGGTLVLPKAEEYRDPQAWLHYLSSQSNIERITLWNTVPALLQMLVEYLEDNRSDMASLDLRLVLMSGDWIPTDLPARIRTIVPTASVISLGGATEASIWSIYYPINCIDGNWTSIPYGKALANQQFYVCQQNLSLSPLGVTGDLYIGGVGLALGYWRDDEKTMASFVIHPETGKRLYKTGDRGRLLADGNIEFMGRIDDQVKIQGYRVELGEIEARLLSHPDISEAVVTTYETRSKHSSAITNNLVAYVVGNTVSPDTVSLSTKDDTSLQKSTKLLAGVDKVTFKLAQKGVREKGLYTSTHLGGDLEADLPLQSCHDSYEEFTSEPISLMALGELLRGYHRRKFGDQIFPKAFYPSGGTLYPVQVYVEIAVNKVRLPNGEWLPSGYYYYHPLDHDLVALETCASFTEMNGDCIKAEVFRVFLVADFAAIKPVYGDASYSLCGVEAGYMSQLLRDNVSSGLIVFEEPITNFCAWGFPEMTDQHGLLAVYSGGHRTEHILRDRSAPNPVSTSSRIVQITPEACHFTSDTAAAVKINAVARKSYRQYLTAAPSLDALGLILSRVHLCAVREPLKVKIYVHLRKTLSQENGEGTLASGFYKFDAIKNALLSVGAESVSSNIALLGSKRGIEAEAAFSLFFTGDPNQENEGFRESGYLGQVLSNHGIQSNIGLCAIGACDVRSVRQVFSLDESAQVFHTLVGGAVSADQLASVDESLVPKVELHQVLASYLQDLLPHYMIPKQVIAIPNIPLTVNGKVDRKSLPEPNISRTESEYLAPQTVVEKSLCEIWQDLLGIEQVSLTDNFFHLGGDSLLATKLITRIQKVLKVKVSIKDIFSCENIMTMSEIIENQLTHQTAEILKENTENEEEVVW